jgi:hypothetical protein
MLDPAEYRARAENCRQMARTATVTRRDFLDAAATWDMLAKQAEELLAYRRGLNRPED